jgi:hypothetical protein
VRIGATVANAAPVSPEPLNVRPVLAPSTVAAPVPSPNTPASVGDKTAPPSVPVAAVATTNAATANAAAVVKGGALPASARPIEIETEATILASVAGGTVAPAALLDVAFFREDSAFTLGVGALAVGTHTANVADAQGTWRRFGGVMDFRLGSRWRTLDLEMHAGLAFTAVSVAGRSLPATSSATIFDPGVLGGLRCRFRLGRLAPFIEATAAYWPRANELFVRGTMGSAELPPFQALFGLGVSINPNR